MSKPVCSYERARAWLDLMGSDAPLPPPDGFQANASAVRTITNEWSELRFGGRVVPPLPELPSIPNLPSFGDIAA